EPAEICDLTGDVEADLDDGDLVRRLHLEERERDADLVVVRSGGPQHAMARAERRGGRLLCRRLPCVAGDPDSGDRVRGAERVEQLLEGERVRSMVRVGGLRPPAPKMAQGRSGGTRA